VPAALEKLGFTLVLKKNAPEHFTNAGSASRRAGTTRSWWRSR
jgi:hypothetical protein